MLGLGYRAGYMVDAVKFIEKEGIDWLKNHRKMSHKEVQNSLVKIKGVGKKVADCVALFSLDQNMSVPVDTHVWYLIILN